MGSSPWHLEMGSCFGRQTLRRKLLLITLFPSIGSRNPFLGLQVKPSVQDELHHQSLQKTRAVKWKWVALSNANPQARYCYAHREPTIKQALFPVHSPQNDVDLHLGAQKQSQNFPKNDSTAEFSWTRRGCARVGVPLPSAMPTCPALLPGEQVTLFITIMMAANKQPTGQGRM